MVSICIIFTFAYFVIALFGKLAQAWQETAPTPKVIAPAASEVKPQLSEVKPEAIADIWDEVGDIETMPAFVSAPEVKPVLLLAAAAIAPDYAEIAGFDSEIDDKEHGGWTAWLYSADEEFISELCSIPATNRVDCSNYNIRELRTIGTLQGHKNATRWNKKQAVKALSLFDAKLERGDLQGAIQQSILEAEQAQEVAKQSIATLEKKASKIQELAKESLSKYQLL